MKGAGVPEQTGVATNSAVTRSTVTMVQGPKSM